MSVEDELGSDSVDAQASRERRHFFRHQLLFVLGTVAAFGGVVASGHRVVGPALFAVGALCWCISGAAAISAQRHMFGRMGGTAWGATYMRASHRGRGGAVVAGAILMLMACALVVLAVQYASRR